MQKIHVGTTVQNVLKTSNKMLTVTILLFYYVVKPSLCLYTIG